MKRARWIALGAAVFFLAFILGVAVNFPGGALSRVVQGQLNTAPGIEVSLEPFRMGLFGMRSGRMTVKEASGGERRELLTLTDLRVPYSFSLFRGLPLRAVIGENGRLAVFARWNGSEVLVEEFSAKLESFPGLIPHPGVVVKGQVTASGKIDLSAPVGARSAQPAHEGGEFIGRGKAIHITGISLAGIAIPEIQLEEITLKLKTGRAIQVEMIEVKGDAQGKITGAVVPIPTRFADSRVSLTVSGSIRPEWLGKTGDMRPLIEGVFPGGRVEGAILGTMGNLTWSMAGGRQ